MESMTLMDNQEKDKKYGQDGQIIVMTTKTTTSNLEYIGFVYYDLNYPNIGYHRNESINELINFIISPGMWNTNTSLMIVKCTLICPQDYDPPLDIIKYLFS